MGISQAQKWLESLSPREHEVLQLIANGMSNRDIAQALFISIETVKWYNKQIFMKLGVRNRTQAANKAAELNLLGSERVFAVQRKPPLPGNLPVQLTSFIGREKEIKEITELLKNHRLVVLTGAGGMGKTRLALEIALSLHKHFINGAYFVSLVSIDSPAQIVSTIAEMIGFSFHEGVDQRQQLLDFLKPKSMLLVLDNFDHLITETTLISKILQAAPDLKIIITSRSRLILQEEQLYPIDGIDVPHDVQSPEEAIRSGAIKLFVQRACLVKHDFMLTDDNVQVIARICQLVEGMPLAILLAAAWVDTITPAQIEMEIRQDFDFLEMRYKDAPKRHWSIRALFDQSWTLLTEREKQIFQALSVFCNGFTSQAAQNVTNISLQELGAFVNKSLLNRTQGNRYQIHELLRQYAIEKLNPISSAYEAAGRSHCDFYVNLLHSRESELKTEKRPSVLMEFKAEFENIRAAWNFAIMYVLMDRLERAMESLATLYQWMGRYQEGEESFRILADKLALSDSHDKPYLLVRALIWQASFNADLGQTDLALGLSRQSLALLDNPHLSNYDTRLERAAALYCLGSVTLRHDYDKARCLWQQSYEIYREVGEEWGMAHVLGYLSMIAWELGNFDEAKELIEENLTIQKTLGNKIDIGNMYSTLGWINLTQGQFKQAEQLARKCTTYYRETGDQALIAKGFRDLAAPKIFLGKFSEADALLEKSIALFKELGGSGDLVFTNVLLGETKAHLGQYDQAHIQEEFTLQLARRFGDRAGEGRARLWLGRIGLAVEDYTQANNWLVESITIFREVGQKDQLCSALASLGYARQALGDVTESQSYLREALQTASEIGAFVPLLYAIPLAALLAIHKGDMKRAIKLYAPTTGFSFVSGSRWCNDVFGQHFPNLGRVMPLEIAEAAQEQGNSQDLWAVVQTILDEAGT